MYILYIYNQIINITRLRQIRQEQGKPKGFRKDTKDQHFPLALITSKTNEICKALRDYDTDYCVISEHLRVKMKTSVLVEMHPIRDERKLHTL